MRRVKCPNGLILDLPDSIASGLVGSVNLDGVVYVDDDAVSPAPEAPKQNASKADWVEYAVARGMARDEAESTSKNDLIDRLK